MKFFCKNHFQLVQLLATLCLLSRVDAQKKSKSDKKNTNDVVAAAQSVVVDPSCGSRVASGCAIMVGLQMVPVLDDVIPSISAFGRASFEFDPAFSEMKYSIEILDENNDPLETSDVTGVYLVCGRAGEILTSAAVTNDSLIAQLQFSSRGTLLEGQFLSDTDFFDISAPVPCGGNTTVAIPNIASVYSTMKKGLISVIAETRSQFNGGVREYIRGQVFLPQDGYMRYSS